ncbi:MAG: FkbM family methyltransferase, partial [Rhodospirillales bacterium]|nr:FkbM family methyltransferase [Rhodospirillales bacterium]
MKNSTNGSFFEVDRTKEIQTLGLVDALLETNLNSIDFLKIDIEGPELSIFESSPEVMREILAVKTEVSY